MKLVNIINILFMLLTSNIYKAIPKKMVGITSALNPKFNVAIDLIKDKQMMDTCVIKRNCHHHSKTKFFYDITEQKYIQKKSKLSFSNQQSEIYLKKNDFIQDKKIISISPGGYKGFYLMGTVAYIKEHYSLEPFIFTGASAGAWNALFMTFNKDPMEIVLEVIDNSIKKAESINELEHIIKYKLLNSYKTEDFDLKRLFIGITTLGNFKINTNIFSDFDDLEDALNCCIASSHIPLVTGGFTNKYNNIYAFDGGFSKYPYLNITKPVLHISPTMWDLAQEKKTTSDIFSYTTLFSRDRYDFMELFDNGYNDAKIHKEFLDSIFLLQ
jgi:hypothetical protein